MCNNIDFNGIFGAEFSDITYLDLLGEFIKKYKPEFPNDESKQCATVLAMFYSNQQLPLCGMLKWMKVDFDRYIKTGDCRPYRLWKHAIEPQKPKPNPINSDSNMSDPGYRGPNGTWSLD